jgi:hypothetical protein
MLADDAAKTLEVKLRLFRVFDTFLFEHTLPEIVVDFLDQIGQEAVDCGFLHDYLLYHEQRGK